MKQTAINDLIIELEQFANFPMVDKATIEAAIDFAKLRLEMEKEQIIDASNNSYLNSNLIKRSSQNKKVNSLGEQYYNETFKTY